MRNKSQVAQSETTK